MEDFRQSTPAVADFYKKNHENQTLEYVLKKKAEYSPLQKLKTTLWEAFDRLDTIVDDSDPDTSEAQTVHAFQTAERMRRDGLAAPVVFTGLIHDLGKILITFEEPQWSVVGDIFPVGCQFDEDAIIYPQYLKGNPDYIHPIYSTKLGIYRENVGFDNVHFSFSHDWYLSHVLSKCSTLSEDMLYMIRYHSFYPAHQKCAYQYLMNDYDRERMPYLRLFSSYDLYSKKDEKYKPDMEYYKKLAEKFIPGDMCW